MVRVIIEQGEWEMLIVKIISIILFSILVIFLLLLACILFLPIRYEVLSEKYEVIKIEIKVRWIKGGMRAHYIKKSDEGKIVKVKILWWTIYEEISSYLETENQLEDTILEHESPKKILHKTRMGGKTEKTLDRLERLDKRVEYEAKEQIVIKDSFSFTDIPISKELFQVIQQFIKGIWEELTPKSIYLCGRYGFEDPSYTGYVFAGLSAAYPFIEADRFEVEPDFEKEVLEGRLQVKGSIRLGGLIKIIIKTVWKKPIRNIIQIYRKKRKGDC